jgi:DNA invertase Pin-like site-specific DNA recombinase
MTTYGYARVSTDGQTLAAQDAKLRAAGCSKVYAEKASGAKTDLAELRRVVARLDEGDVLMVTRLDRLARSTRDLLDTLDAIAKKGAGFHMGRPPKLTPRQRREALARRQAGETLTEIARTFDVSHTTIGRL